MNETKSQEQMILAALQQGRKIDPMIALNDYSCFRLASRICALRKDHEILDEWFTTASGKKVKRYYIPAGQMRLIA